MKSYHPVLNEEVSVGLWKSSGYDGLWIQTDLPCQRSALSDCSCFTHTTSLLVYSIQEEWLVRVDPLYVKIWTN